MRVGVGLNKDGLTNAGGDCPDVRLFNEVHEKIGTTTDPGYVGEGDYKDVEVDQDSYQQPISALISANNNANKNGEGHKDGICLAYLQVVWPDGQNYAWVGNWARHCGERW